jgi:hypothetical protein
MRLNCDARSSSDWWTMLLHATGKDSAIRHSTGTSVGAS